MNDEANSETGLNEKSTASDSIRPGFLRRSGGDEEKQRGAANGLMGLEKAASNTPQNNGDGVDGAKAAENAAEGGFYQRSKKSKQKTGSVHFKKAGPIGLLITLIFGGGLLLTGGQSMQLIAWKENVMRLFGQNSAVINKRSNFIFNNLLETNKETTKTTFLGKEKYKIGTKLQEKLKEQGIEYAETKDADGKSLRMLVYKDGDNYTPIVADGRDTKKVGGTYTDADGNKVKLASAMTLSDARTKYTNFATSFDTATITFTGRVAGWFDDTTSVLLKRIGGKNPRNKTKDLTNESTEEDVKNTIYKNSSGGARDTSLDLESSESEEAEGQKVKDGNDSLSVGGDEGNVEAKLTERAKKAASSGSDIACSILQGVGAVGVAVGAIQVSNTISYALTYLETADKIKAGDANNAVNLIANELNRDTTVTAYDIDGKAETKAGSAAASKGFSAVFADTDIIDENDSSALRVNREYAMTNALRGSTSSGALANAMGSAANFGGKVSIFKACAGIQSSGAVASLVLTFVGGGVFSSFVKGIFKVALMAAATTAIGVIVGAIVPYVSSWLADNLEDLLAGDVGGYALYAGAHSLLDSNLQMSTGKYATKEEAIELSVMTDEIEDEWAEYDRKTLSPLDATSQYTFLGSIVSSVMPIINALSGKQVTSVVSASTGVASQALAGMMGDTVSAASEVKSSLSFASDNNCPSLIATGVAGDFACNKYSGAYVDELSTLSVEESYEKMKALGSFVEGEEYSDGNPKVNANSDYAKYIVACVTSDTQPGSANGAVAGYVSSLTNTDSSVANGLINFGMNFVPVVGDVATLVQTAEDAANLKWTTGEACTGNTGDAAIDEAVKYYSMYNLDQRVLLDMGVIEESSTVAFLEDYYEEHPIDNSLEGIIAQYGGLTEDEVESVMGQLEYLAFLANYDASERYAFGGGNMETDESVDFGSEDVLGGEVKLLPKVVYADVRNRNFVA